MNVYKYLDFHNKAGYKDYCEIIITQFGGIELATPSHLEKLIELYCKNMNISREEAINRLPLECSPASLIIDKYNYIAVWYNYLVIPAKINRFQKKTLKILTDNNIIHISKVSEAKEYRWYIKFRESRNLNMEV